MQINTYNFALFFADNDIEDGKMHLPFKLSSSGETIQLNFLDNQNIITIDELIFSSQQADISFGRYPDGDSNTVSFIHTTPNRSNYIVITSLDAYHNNEMNFFPNPFSNVITIQNEFNQVVAFQIKSILGKTIIAGKTNSNEYRINLEHLAPQVYILMIGTNSFKIVKK